MQKTQGSFPRRPCEPKTSARGGPPNLQTNHQTMAQNDVASNKALRLAICQAPDGFQPKQCAHGLSSLSQDAR